MVYSCIYIISRLSNTVTLSRTSLAGMKFFCVDCLMESCISFNFTVSCKKMVANGGTLNVKDQAGKSIHEIIIT